MEKAGWKLVEKMRQGFGENRPLQLSAFLVPGSVFGWVAYIVTNSNGFFVHISHEEDWVVVARTRGVYDKLFSELKELNPTESCEIGIRFCRP